MWFLEFLSAIGILKNFSALPGIPCINLIVLDIKETLLKRLFQHFKYFSTFTRVKLTKQFHCIGSFANRSDVEGRNSIVFVDLGESFLLTVTSHILPQGAVTDRLWAFTVRRKKLGWSLWIS